MSGLDPSARKTVKDFIRNLKKKGRTIFLNTHNLDDAQQLCDRVAVINTRLIAIDSPENLGKGLWKPKLAITLRRIEDVNKAFGLLSEYGEIEQIGKRIEVSIKNVEEDNPKILHKLFSSSIEVVYAEEVKHTLEESYLELLRRVGAR
jgi:ABC-2 type transport system ATP-binding protein